MEYEESGDATDRVAAAAIRLYDVSSDAVVERINVSENTTYRVTDSGEGRRYALRVHRLGTGRRRDRVGACVDRRAPEAGNVETAGVVAARDGSRVVSVSASMALASETRSCSSG